MTMTSRDAVQVIVTHRADALVISTMTSMRWLDELSPSPLNLSSVPMMGGASALGLGLARARPERPVLVLDADGSLLMQLGTLATVAGLEPENFYHFVFDNGVWFEGGGNISVPAAGRIDFAATARSVGYRGSHRFDDARQLDAALPSLLEEPGPRMVHLMIEADPSVWNETRPQPFMPDSQFTRMGNEARAMRAELLGPEG